MVFLSSFAFRTESRPRCSRIFTGRRDGVSATSRRDAVDARRFLTRCAAQVNLGALNERWAKIEFLCDFYKGTDVPLLKFGEEDYEALENDQLTVQGMMAVAPRRAVRKRASPCGP